MDSKTASKILEEAQRALDVTGAKAAYELLEPLIAEGSPEAIFLYSTFSCAEEETEEGFEMRRIKLLRDASSAGYAPAIYELAVCYDIGDMVEIDVALASALYRQAAEAGYPKAKLSYGLSLFYGSLGMQKDESLGLAMITQAAAEHVDGAIEALEGVVRINAIKLSSN